MLPYPVQVEIAKVAVATRKTVVVAARLKRASGIVRVEVAPAEVNTSPSDAQPPTESTEGCTAEVAEKPPIKEATVAVFAGMKLIWPETSQSPAVRDTEVMLAATVVVRLRVEANKREAVLSSPIVPARAVSAVAVP